MSGRRLPLLVLLVVGSVAIVALVAHGRPLAAGAGRSGLPASFWSYALTTTIILFALRALLILVALFNVRMTFTKPTHSWVTMFFRSFIGLIVIGVALTFILHRSHHGSI